MQVFLTSPTDLEESARDLDDSRLNKQIVEICQILTANYNVNAGANNLGHSNHPVTKWYNGEQANRFLIKYGFSLCYEFSVRHLKTHQGFFTIMGFYSLPKYSDSKDFKPAFIKGRKDTDQVITTDKVGERYKELLTAKWNEGSPKWTNRNKPEWYKEEK